MSHQPDLDQLIRRLRETAADLDVDSLPLGPPLGGWHQQLVRMADARQRPYLSDPRHPCLAELMAVDDPAEAFVELAYRHLLGRSPDAEGRAHYAKMAHAQGRLTVLVELAHAEEARHHVARQGLTLPQTLSRLLAWRARLDRSGVLRRVALKAWAKALAGLAKCRARHWSREAVAHRLHHGLPVLAAALLELNDRQRHLAEHQPGSAGVSRRTPQVGAEASPEGFQAFLAECKAGDASPDQALAPFSEELKCALALGRQALVLGAVPADWLDGLVRLGFEPLSAPDQRDAAQGQGLEHGEHHAEALPSAFNNGIALFGAFQLLGATRLDELYELVGEARRCLMPGGMLLLEEAGPGGSMPLDPQPLTPATLEHLLRFHGFTELRWRESGGELGAARRRALVGFAPRGDE